MTPLNKIYGTPKYASGTGFYATLTVIKGVENTVFNPLTSQSIWSEIQLKGNSKDFSH